MTTKPKARRFRLRLGDDAAATVRPSVAPQRDAVERAAAAAAPQRPAQPTRRAAPIRPSADERPRGDAPAAPANGPSDALFDESAARSGSEARPAPRPNPQYTLPDASDGGDAPGQSALRRASITEHGADVGGAPGVEAEIEAIRAEELTGRQLRMAMRVAQRHGVKATSGIEAVRLLRRQGIDPFEPSTLLDIVRDQSRTVAGSVAGAAGGIAAGALGTTPGETGRALTTTEQPKLPKTYRQPAPPAATPPAPSPVDEARRRDEISRIQKDIARRRRRRMTLLAARLLVFVFLPTAIVAYYLAVIATPLYATNSEFVIQQAEGGGGAASAGGFASMLGGSALGSVQDSITVQSYLQSRDAMRRLNSEEGFIAYFQQPGIDPLRRLDPDTTDEAAYRLYQDVVLVSFDPTEGIIRMEVIAADPETSERFARALVQYAEEQVDQLTARLRGNQMSDAVGAVAMAEQRFSEAQQRVLDLQERFQILSSEVEVTLLTEQIGNLEAQLTQETLALSDLQANARPNRARLEQTQRRIAAIEAQIAAARANLTEGGEGGMSLARVQRELIMAESDVQTRQMLLAQAMQSQEAARLEANRQVRYLAIGVNPVAPDEPTYPRVFENTALAFLIFAGIYLMVSMTSAILREQVTG